MTFMIESYGVYLATVLQHCGIMDIFSFSLFFSLFECFLLLLLLCFLLFYFVSFCFFVLSCLNFSYFLFLLIPNSSSHIPHLTRFFPVIKCSSLPIPLNGFKVGCLGNISDPYDSRCSFSCNVGYNLYGSSNRRCLHNGTWSGETTSCQGQRKLLESTCRANCGLDL